MSSMPRNSGTLFSFRRCNLWCVADHSIEKFKQLWFHTPPKLNSTYYTRDNVTVQLEYECCPMEWMHPVEYYQCHDSYWCWSNSIDGYALELFVLPECYWFAKPTEVKFSKALLDTPVPDFIKKLGKK